MGGEAAKEGAETCEEKDKADHNSQEHEDAKEWAKDALERQVANFVRYAEQSDAMTNK